MNEVNKIGYAVLEAGNSRGKAEISGRQYFDHFPHSVAKNPSTEPKIIKAPQDYMYSENIETSINSAAITDKNGHYYVGISATKKKEQIGAKARNEKAKSETAYRIMLTQQAWDLIQQYPELDYIEVETELVIVMLPPGQVESDKEIIKKNMRGRHEVTFHGVLANEETGATKTKTVSLFNKRTAVAIEGSAGFQAILRDYETLKYKNEQLKKVKVLVGDLGGETFDFVTIENERINENEEVTRTFDVGINDTIDKIMVEVRKEYKREFASRFELEQILLRGKSNWEIMYRGKSYSIAGTVEKYFKQKAEQVLNVLDNMMNEHELQDVERILLIGGGVELIKYYINELNNQRQESLPFEIVEEAAFANVKGASILARIALKEMEKQNIPVTTEG